MVINKEKATILAARFITDKYTPEEARDFSEYVSSLDDENLLEIHRVSVESLKDIKSNEPSTQLCTFVHNHELLCKHGYHKVIMRVAEIQKRKKG